MSLSKSREEPIAHNDDHQDTLSDPYEQSVPLVSKHPGGDNQGSVQDHSNRHTREKPYQCPKPGCDKSYSWPRSLQRHIDTHHAASPPAQPNSAFLVFRSELSRRLQALGEDFGQHTISKTAGKLWRELPETQKQVYKDKARDLKAKHKEMYPDYQRAPRKKRIKLTEEEKVAAREYMIANAPNPSILWEASQQESRLEHYVQDPGMLPPSFSHASWPTTDPYYASAPSTYQKAPF
ncbi:high mobility group box domain-containing protein [Mucidula mucida]|nr:high mobility group box domain-containing protein [Mucidula mucida]